MNIFPAKRRLMAVNLSSAILSLLAAMPASGQGSQDRFIFGIFWDPPMVRNNTATNQVRLGHVVDAGFNLLTGVNNGQSIAFDPVLNGPGWTDENIYKLRMVATLNQNRGRTALRMTVMDYAWLVNMHVNSVVNTAPIANRYGPNAVIGPAGSSPTPTYTLVDNGGLSNTIGATERARMRTAFLGYHVVDEPHENGSMVAPNDRTNTLAWIAGLSATDPNRIAWANLFPSYVIGEPNPAIANITQYEAYVNSFINHGNTRVVSFDHYAFGASFPGGMRNDYFYNLRLFATGIETNRALGTEKTFWAYPLSAEHNPYSPISEENLRFSSYAPLAYGAKGLVYFTYARPGPYLSSLLDQNNTPCTEARAPSADCPQGIYTWAQRINRSIGAMGDVLFNTFWVTTVHGSAFDPVSGEALPVIDATTPTLISQQGNTGAGAGTGTAHLATGLFSYRFSSTNYLLILNKDRGNNNTATITVLGNLFPQRHLQTDDVWESIDRTYDAALDRTTFSVPIIPGGGQLVHLSTASLIPGMLQPLLLN